jgi:hypothetical protein
MTALAAAKPVAPVTVTITAKPDGTVTLVATATQAVPAMTLVLGGKRQTFGATKAGDSHAITVAAPTGDVTGQAIVGHRVRPALLSRTAKKPAPAPVLRTISGGRVVGEVR